jgi:hypothetical protein
MKCKVCKRKVKFYVAMKHILRLLTHDALWVISDLGRVDGLSCSRTSYSNG